MIKDQTNSFMFRVEHVQMKFLLRSKIRKNPILKRFTHFFLSCFKLFMLFEVISSEQMIFTVQQVIQAANYLNIEQSDSVSQTLEHCHSHLEHL